MFQRSATIAAAALASAAVIAVAVPAATATAAPQAAAATAPGFIKGTDLPKHPSSPWTAGPVTKGLPDNGLFCMEKTFPATGVWHRQYGTDVDAHAVQISVRAGSGTAAKKLAAALEKKVAACAADWLRKTSGGTASWKDYGKLTVEEGAHAYGVHTEIPDSEPGVHLFGIGRDGSTVTVVEWSQMGNLTHAPATAFKKTTVTAVNKLNP